MARKQLTLTEKIEVIAREMCRDLGLDPDWYIEGYGIQWQQYKELVEKNLVEDALHLAKEKLDRGRIGQE